MLKIQQHYPPLSTIPVSVAGEVKDTMLNFTPAFYKAFCEQYSDHQCEFPGCKTTVVLDGNMKNRRDICFAKDAGSISYPGLPGHIKTGCVASPAYKSRYCQNHQARSCEATNMQNDSSDTRVVEVLLSVKETRGSKYYQVLWLGKPNLEVTWEPESSLPIAVVQEFENKISSEAYEQTASQYGYESSTIMIADNEKELQPNKRAKMERPVMQDHSDGVLVDRIPAEVSCNTLKDSHGRLNFRTADFICYDDACHLKKFARNPIRANLTPQTKTLASVEMVVDKMHMKGHTDPWCKENCDANKFEKLSKVDTKVCEQVFSWLSRYSRMTNKMNQHTFIFFILYVCQLHNKYEEKKLIRTGFLAVKLK